MIQSKAKDYIFNILASLSLVSTLQLFVYPYIAKHSAPEEYGKILLHLAVVNIMVLSFGNTLSNIRLIKNSEYLQKSIVGDFKIIFVITLAVASLGSLLIAQYLDLSLPVSAMAALVVLFGVTRSYLCVEYRLRLSFGSILGLNLLLSSAYLLLIHIYPYLQLPWIGIFFLAELAAIIYLSQTLQFVHKEPFRKTELFQNTTYTYLCLMSIGAIANIIVYIDRVLIYPLLGAEAVAIYFCASFLGKAIGVVVTPISSVLLSRYSQSSYIMNKGRFFRNIRIYAAICIVTYIVLQTSGDSLVAYLYSGLYAKAKPYIWLGNLAAIVGVLANIINPAILKCIPLKLQLLAQIFYLAVYVLLCYTLSKELQLLGLCFAILAANLIKLATQLYLGYRYIGDN